MKLCQVWARYWFRPSPLLDLAILRVLAVSFQLGFLFAYFRPIPQLVALPDALYRPLPVLRLLTWPVGAKYRPPHELLELVYWLTLAAGVLALIGLWTKISLGLFALGSVFLQGFSYSFNEIHHPDAVVIIALGILALSPAGRVLSIDDLRHRLARAARSGHVEPSRLLGETDPFARWPLLLVGWVMALVYMSAASSKLTTAGLDWMNGYTLQYYMVQDGLRWNSALGLWFGQHHLVAQFASWATILFESTFFLILVVPALALFYLPFGMAFHTAIYLIQRAPFFQFITLYAAFVPWAACLTWLVRRRSTGRGPLVIYDRQCPTWVAWMTVLSWLDWGDRVALVDLESYRPGPIGNADLSLDELRQEMHVILPEGTVHRGFFALRALLPHLPLLWPLRILLALPGASAVGPALCRTVVRRRARDRERRRRVALPSHRPDL